MQTYQEFMELMESIGHLFRNHYTHVLHNAGFKSYHPTTPHFPEHHVNNMIRHVPTHHRISGGQVHFHHPDGHTATLSDHVLNIKHSSSQHSIDIHRDRHPPGGHLATTIPHHAVKQHSGAQLLTLAKKHSIKMSNASHRSGIGVSHLTIHHL